MDKKVSINDKQAKAFELLLDKLTKAAEKAEKSGERWDNPVIAKPHKGVRNAISGRRYSAGNELILYISEMVEKAEGTKLEYPGLYMTFKQIKENGGNLKKGSKGIPLKFMKEGFKWEPKLDENGQKIFDKNGREVKEKKEIKIARGFTVFQAKDIEKIDFKAIIEKEDASLNKQKEKYGLKEIRTDLKSKIETEAKALGVGLDESNRNYAYYAIKADKIHMPDFTSFKAAKGSLPELPYLATFSHEMGHAVNYRCSKEEVDIANKSRAKAELVAETFSFFYLMKNAGNLMPKKESMSEKQYRETTDSFNKEILNNAKYINSWSKGQSDEDKTKCFKIALKCYSIFNHSLERFKEKGIAHESTANKHLKEKTDSHVKTKGNTKDLGGRE